MPSSEETLANVDIEYTYTATGWNRVAIDLIEYRAWLGLQADESFEFTEGDIIEFLQSGSDFSYETTNQYGLEDVRIENVSFDCG